jgi:hypothetical protein
MTRITHGSHLFVPDTGASTVPLSAMNTSLQPVKPTGCEVRRRSPLGLPPALAMTPPRSSTMSDVLLALVDTCLSVPPRKAASSLGSTAEICTRVPLLALNGSAV